MAHSANLLGALKEQYLTKCGGGHKSWKTRWFVLTKDVLYYFDKEISSEPLGVIQLKDYCRCKGMSGDAFQITKKDHSFFLEMPYRTYKMFASDWRTAEEWAESISNIGDFIRKKEEIRNASPLQTNILTNTNDIINYGSSLIHWFKLIVDSTATYKKGVQSIYLSGIYDIPRDLGRQIIVLARDALNAVASPRSPALYDKYKAQLQRINASLEKAVSFITCCAPDHKGNFNSDLEVIKRAVSGLSTLAPCSPVEEITQPAVALGKACRQLCQPYLDTSDRSSAPPPTPSSISALVKELSAAVEANLALKAKTTTPADQQYVQLIRSALDKSKSTSLAIVEIVQKASVDVNRLDPLYDELTKSCRDIITAGQKLFSDLA